MDETKISKKVSDCHGADVYRDYFLIGKERGITETVEAWICVLCLKPCNPVENNS